MAGNLSYSYIETMYAKTMRTPAKHAILEVWDIAIGIEALVIDLKIK